MKTSFLSFLAEANHDDYDSSNTASIGGGQGGADSVAKQDGDGDDNGDKDKKKETEEGGDDADGAAKDGEKNEVTAFIPRID